MKKNIGYSCVFFAGMMFAAEPHMLWDYDALNRTPQTHEVQMACSNNYGLVEGVLPVWIEGEPYKGKPTRIFAWWGLPKGAGADNKVPAMVLVHGGGGTAFANWVKTWNDRGYAAIALDTCGKIPQGERDGKPHNTHPWSGPSGWGSSVLQVNEPLKDQWTYHAVAAVMRCHSFLRARPEIDAERTGITGISWGGYLTSIVMSVDGRFKFAAPVYGCGWYGMNRYWSGMGAKENYVKWLALWDPKHYLLDIDRYGVKGGVLWCCGTNDHFYPLDAVKRSSDLVASRVPLMMTIKLRMPHGHPPAGDPKEIAALADCVLKGGTPLTEISSVEFSNGKFNVTFNSHGRKVSRIELLQTKDDDPVLEKRNWAAKSVNDFDLQKGTFSVDVAGDVKMFFANVCTDDGLVVSTRIFAGK